jgi:hypothetical protein
MAITTKCDSEVFKKWISTVDDILSRHPRTTIDGQPLEYTDDEYQDTMRKLEQSSMNFEDMPIYPINETIANRLIQDQERGADERPDI